MKNKEEEKVVHRNIPQLLVNAIMAKIMVLLWARGTGKTEGGMGPWSLNNVKEMPGGVSAIGTDSYKHLRKQILPELEKTWRKFGMVKGQDYWIDKFPDKNLGVPEAIRPISEPENVVFWRNGHAIKLFSFNFQSLQTGDSIDALGVEEGKDVNHVRLLEVLPTLRGNDEAEWAGKSCHHSLLVVSDMPDDISGQWMLDYAEKMDEGLLATILKIVSFVSLFQDKLDNEDLQAKEKEELQQAIDLLNEKLNRLRKKAVFVSFASTLENLHALGKDVIQNLLNVLSTGKFRSSVMNEIPKKQKDCFYHFLSKKQHGYVALNDSYIQSVKDKTKDDCRWDSDLTNRELYLAMDYNGRICTAVVGQYDPIIKQVKFVKNFYVLLEEQKGKDSKNVRILRKLCKDIAAYYKYRSNRNITYFYDNTAIGKDADRDETGTYKAIVEAELSDANFRVNAVRVEQTTHKERFDEWERVLSDDADAPFSFLFNKENCNEWYNATTNTKTKFLRRFSQDGKPYLKFEKNKDDELKKNIHPLQATHITEAGDTLLTGIKQEQNSTRIFLG